MVKDLDSVDQEFAEVAKENLAGSHGGLPVAIGLTATILSFGAASPLVAACFGLLTVTTAYKSYKGYKRRWDLLESGSIEEALNPNQRSRYLRQKAIASSTPLQTSEVAPQSSPHAPAVDPNYDPQAFLPPPVAVEEDRPLEWVDDEPQPQEAAVPEPIAPPSINPAFVPDFEARQFQWEWLRDRDAHPKLALIAPMGGGKSRLIRYLAGHILFDGVDGFDGVVYDICGRANEWKGYTVVTDHARMLNEMHSDIQAIAQRLNQYRAGQDHFPPFFRVLEEAVDTLPTLASFGKQAKETIDSWQRQFGSATRKLNALAVYVSTELVADAIGMSAGGRNSSTLVFPGTSGIALAMTDATMLKLGSRENKGIRDQLNVKLSQCQYPALVYHQGRWYWADIPYLSPSGDPVDGSTQPEQPAADQSTDVAQKLLNWLKGTGLQYSINGIYTPQAIATNFAFKRNKKTTKLSVDELKQCIAELHKAGAIEVVSQDNSRFVKVKEVSSVLR